MNFNRLIGILGQHLGVDQTIDLAARKLLKYVLARSRLLDLCAPFEADGSMAESDLTQRILSMSPEASGALGISKTAHWLARTVR